jgi:hypothetical protein
MFLENAGVDGSARREICDANEGLKPAKHAKCAKKSVPKPIDKFRRGAARAPADENKRRRAAFRE